MDHEKLPKVYWTKCSCGHIAQDHDQNGKCERDGCVCAECKGTKCGCKGYDGHRCTTNNK